MPQSLHLFTRDAMACTFEIRIAEDEPDHAASAAAAAFEELDRLEQDFSRFVPSSDVARINNAAGKKPVRVSPPTYDVLAIAVQVFRETSGAFDVTWGSHPGPTGSTPWAHTDVPPPEPLILDAAAYTAFLPVANTRIDLGAIGKGYALDVMAQTLRDWKIPAALLSSGQSTVLALGPPDDQPPFRVALRDPNRQTADIGSATLRNCALSGSGTLLHGPHIIDPRTGAPARGKLGTWCAAPSGAVSDALSTAFMVMSRDAVAAFCARYRDIAGLLLAEGQPPAVFGAPGVGLNLP